MRILALALVLALTPLAHAQGKYPNGGRLQQQQEALQKLNFLIGRWTGDATLTPASGPAIKLAQTNIVQYKSNGTILEISGNGIAPDGSAPRSTLVTITYDDDSFTYHITTNTNGHAITADLALVSHGYAWAYIEGDTKTTTTVLLTENADWSETIQVTAPNTAPRTTFQMLLHLQP
jgi:hypothetical protein